MAKEEGVQPGSANSAGAAFGPYVPSSQRYRLQTRMLSDMARGLARTVVEQGYGLNIRQSYESPTPNAYDEAAQRADDAWTERGMV